MKTIIIFLTISLAVTSAQAAGPVDSNIYDCTSEGHAETLFDKQIQIDLTTDHRFITFYGSDGMNCNGSEDPGFHGRSSAIKYRRFFTDCESEDGFYQVLVSESLSDGASRGLAKLRIQGANFAEAFYRCNKR